MVEKATKIAKIGPLSLKFQKKIFFIFGIILIFPRENKQPWFFLFWIFKLKQPFFNQYQYWLRANFGLSVFDCQICITVLGYTVGYFHSFGIGCWILYYFLKFKYSNKATKFCEISAVDLTVTTYVGQIYYGGDFTKICGLLRMYELYLWPHISFSKWVGLKYELLAYFFQ